MKMQDMIENKNELTALCDTVRAYVRESDYQKCEFLILDAMKKFPHAPEPHNLIGLLLEMQGDHLAAMKHFRAAWALDPTSEPFSPEVLGPLMILTVLLNRRRITIS